MRDIIVRVIADTSGMAAGLTKASSSISAFGRKTSAAGRTLTRSVTLPVVAAGAASVKMALDFEDSMTNVQALVGASGKQMRTYETQVLEMAKTLPQAPKELADALYFVTSSGFEGAGALKVLRASAEAAAAGLGDTETVADAVTSAVNAFGPATLSARNATDVLVATVREGKGEASELAGVIGRVIPLSSELGVSFQDTGAALASMTLSGLDAAEATTALRGIFTALLKPTTDGEEALKKVGLSVEELRRSMVEDGLIETLLMLKDRLGDNKEALADVFPNVRALAGFLNLTGKNAQKNVGIFDDLRESTGATAKAWDDASKSSGNQLRVALNKLRVAAIDLGKRLVPILVDDIIPAIEKVVDWWESLSDAQKSNVLKWLAIAAAAGPVLRILGGLITVVGGLTKALGGLTGVLGSVTKMFGASGAAVGAAGPVWLGLAASIAAAVGWMQRAQLGLKGIAEGLIASQSAIATGGLFGGFLTGGISGLFDRALNPEKYREAAEQAAFLNDQLQPMLDTLYDLGGRLSETEAAQIEAAIAAGDHARALQIANSALSRFRADQAIQQQRTFVDSMMQSKRALAEFQTRLAQQSGLNRKQTKTLTPLIDNIYQYGRGLTKAKAAALHSAIASGDFARAMKIVKGAIDKLPKGKAEQVLRGTGKQAKVSAKELKGMGAAAARGVAEVNGLSIKASGASKNLKDAGASARNAKGDIEGVAGAAKKVPRNIPTKVEANTSQAKAAIDSFIASQSGRTIYLNVAARGGGGVASGGIIGAARGMIARGPTMRGNMLVGEGNYATFAGRGAEAVVPLNARGIAILAKAMEKAEGGRGQRVAGEVSIGKDGRAWFEGVVLGVLDDQHVPTKRRTGRLAR